MGFRLNEVMAMPVTELEGWLLAATPHEENTGKKYVVRKKKK